MLNMKNSLQPFDTRQSVVTALCSILEENGMDIGSITVTELAERAAIGRATFYRHFDNPLDVLAWAIDQEAQVAIGSIPLSDNGYAAFARDFFKHWTLHSDLLGIIMETKNSDLFVASLEHYLEEISVDLFATSSLSSNRRPYLITIWSSVLWSVLKAWIANGRRETAEELANITYHNFILPPVCTKYIPQERSCLHSSVSVGSTSKRSPTIA